jgi:CRP-like cAMP-binding protein
MTTIDSTSLSHPFLAGMDEKDLRQIAPLATAIHFPANHVIFHEGDPADAFFLIVDGKVAVESHARARGAIVVQTVESGGALGWSWLFEPFTWHFDARAVRPTDAIMVDAKGLRALCDQNPHLGYALTRRVAHLVIQRLHETQIRLCDTFAARSLETWETRK